MKKTYPNQKEKEHLPLLLAVPPSMILVMIQQPFKGQ
jgi:hypothetical protein